MNSILSKTLCKRSCQLSKPSFQFRSPAFKGSVGLQVMPIFPCISLFIVFVGFCEVMNSTAHASALHYKLTPPTDTLNKCSASSVSALTFYSISHGSFYRVRQWDARIKMLVCLGAAKLTSENHKSGLSIPTFTHSLPLSHAAILLKIAILLSFTTVAI